VNKRNCHGTLVIDREAQEARLVVIMMKAWYLLVTASVRPNAQNERKYSHTYTFITHMCHLRVRYYSIMLLWEIL
jgi:hypothetical protein